jgi:hypothetical protein
MPFPYAFRVCRITLVPIAWEVETFAKGIYISDTWRLLKVEEIFLVTKFFKRRDELLLYEAL